jgi:hypothetical protein
MRCEVAERRLSARLDGDRLHRADPALEDHVAGCARCQGFRARAERVRHLARLAPAEPVPDLVPRIMAEVRAGRPGRPVPPAWSRYAAAFVAGGVAAALVAGGLPGLRRGPTPALATAIPRRVAEASTEVTRYRATFDVVERGFHRLVPRRTFTAEIAFVAPERFRAELRDTTAYPDPTWPRNDVLLAGDGDRWLLDAPTTCPRQALPTCAVGGRTVQSVRGREPFDGDTLLPTDIVLPVRTLAGTERVRVVGRTSVAGQEAVVVELAALDATPLFAFLQAGGAWRPFFPQDRVLVSLDAASLFPLAYEVRAAASPERDAWALRMDLDREAPGALLLRAEVRSFHTDVPAGWRPIRGPLASARDEGFRQRPTDGLHRAVGYRPAVPRDLGGLRPYRAGTFASGDRPADEVLLSYTRGLAWLKMRQTRSWSQGALFGDVGPLARQVPLPGGGVGYYEPATGTLGRRLSLHAPGWDLYLESNLPREVLLRVAGSLPVRGALAPEAWLDQVPLDQALSVAPYLLLPRSLPEGYGFWSAHLEGGGVTLYFRRPGTELDGAGIRLHQAEGVGLPPPLDPDVLAVQVRGVTGRYTPARGELEWVEDGVYRSIGGASLDLAGALRVAGSLEVPR